RRTVRGVWCGTARQTLCPSPPAALLPHPARTPAQNATRMDKNCLWEGRKGERENGRMGEWENGRKCEERLSQAKRSRSFPSPPPSAAGGLDAEAVAGGEAAGELGREGLFAAVRADEGVAAGGAGEAAGLAGRAGVAALAQEGDGGRGEQLVLAHDAVAAAVLPRAAAARAQAVAHDAERIGP